MMDMMSKPNLITIDLDALPGVLTESLRRVLTAHKHLTTYERSDGPATSIDMHLSRDPAEALLREVGRNGAQAVAAATQLRGTDDQADALAELQEYLDRAAQGRPECGPWATALRALRGG